MPNSAGKPAGLVRSRILCRPRVRGSLCSAATQGCADLPWATRGRPRVRRLAFCSAAYPGLRGLPWAHAVARAYAGFALLGGLPRAARTCPGLHAVARAYAGSHLLGGLPGLRGLALGYTLSPRVRGSHCSAAYPGLRGLALGNTLSPASTRARTLRARSERCEDLRWATHCRPVCGFISAFLGRRLYPGVMNHEAHNVAFFLEMWTRRALTISVCLLIWFCYWRRFRCCSSEPADRSRARRLLVLTRCVLFFTSIFLRVFGIIASFVIWLGSGVWAAETPNDFSTGTRVAAIVGRALCLGALRIFGISIEVEGVDELRTGPVIVFLRHASVADTLLPAVFIANPNGLRLRYVLKHELLLDPCLDIVGNRLPNSFVRRSSGDSYRVVELMKDLGARDGVIVYPEGTRFTKAKRDMIIEQLERKGETYLAEKARELKNVLPPRLGGPLNLLAANEAADVVFCAHFGFDGVVDLRDFLRGSLVGRVVNVRFWRVPFASIPKTREAQTRWLFENWMLVMSGWGGKKPAK